MAALRTAGFDLDGGFPSTDLAQESLGSEA